jgi:hypothetical protein
MTSILDWFLHNKGWVFSGVGIPVATGLFFLLRAIFRRAAPNSAATLPPPPSPALQANLAFGFLTYGPELSDQMLIFAVGNPSDRPTQLTGLRLPLKNGANMVFPYLDGEKRLPCMVEPGTSRKFWVKLSDVEASIRIKGYAGSLTVPAVASDGLGNDYESNTVTVA